jgi:hypothetical protein
MPVALATVRTELRQQLDELSARFWADTELNALLNEGARDVARRTETGETFTQTIPAISGTMKYALPTNFLRAHRVEFQPISTGMPQVYPLQLATYYEMDQYWGSTQFQQRSYPGWAVFFGNPPNTIMQIYPVPSQNGNFNLFYYALPSQLVADTDQLQVTEGWYDVVKDYACWKALMKDRDPRWQDYKQLYEEDLVNMIDVTRKHHDQAGTMTRGGFAQPLFPYAAWGDL